MVWGEINMWWINSIEQMLEILSYRWSYSQEQNKKLALQI